MESLSKTFAGLLARYDNARAEHQLGKALVVQNEIAQFICSHGFKVLSALSRAEEPLSEGTECEDEEAK